MRVYLVHIHAHHVRSVYIFALDRSQSCSFIIGSKGLSWKYFMGQKNGLPAFGYNSAESEPIWRKSGTVWTKCGGLALADFGRDPRSSDSLRGSWNFVFFFVR